MFTDTPPDRTELTLKCWISNFRKHLAVARSNACCYVETSIAGHMMFHAAERPAVPTRKLLDMNQSYAKRPVLGRDGLRRMAVGWKGGLTDMRIDTLVVCAGLLVWTLSGCGGAQSGTFDKPLVSSGTGAADPSISNPTSGSGAIA